MEGLIKIPSAWIPGETHIFQKGMFLRRLLQEIPADTKAVQPWSRFKSNLAEMTLHSNSETLFHMADIFLSIHD